MKTLKSISILLTVISQALSASAQSTKPQLEVVHERESSGAAVMGMVKKGVEDTAQVNLILKAARVYYHNVTPGKLELDTVISLAGKTYHMSRRLNYGEGIVESAFLLCKVQTKRENPRVAEHYLNLVNGEGKVRLLLCIAEYYAFNFESDSREFSKALPLIDKAQAICNSVNSFRWLAECGVLRGKFYFRKGDIKEGRKAFLGVIDSYEKRGDFAKAAEVWSKLGNSIPENSDNFDAIKLCYENAIKDFLKGNDKEQMAYTLRDLAVLNGNHQQLDSCEKQLLRVVSTLKSINKPVKFTTYNIIASFYSFAGKYDRALFFALKAKAAPDLDERKKVASNDILADLYNKIGKKELALKYYMDAHAYLEPKDLPGMFLSAYYIALLQADMGRARDGRLFLDNFLKKHRPESAVRRQNFAYAYGDIYAKLKEYSKAESYYREMLSLDKDAAAELAKDIDNNKSHLPGSGAAFVMGRFLVGQRRFAESRAYLMKALSDPSYSDAEELRDTYHLMFRADSAVKNYLPAIKYFQRFKTMNDSINSLTRIRQFEDLNVKYQTEQKEKNIKFLENKQKLQAVIIQRSDTIRKFTVAGIGMLFLLFAITFIAFKNKQRSNKKLTRQRGEINDKNEVLETLLFEKDSFLKEKDWLLKEIHHRVKNNLQIIISLLSTQSVYLENNAALEAIEESQNRVHSIALIHQKLYTSDNPASIGMAEYVSDLIENLSEGFDAKKRNIVFRHSIDQLNIDLSQAVPLGLILNESITNAIKYAFGEKGGMIMVTITFTGRDRIMLSVEDNGIGLPEDFDIRSVNSLGMELMKGLSKQLRGEFNISGSNGVHVSVEFDLLKTLAH